MTPHLAWVAALPSDDEEEDEVQQRWKTSAVPAEAEGNFHVMEDDDVQVLNVVKGQERHRQPGVPGAGRMVDSWQEGISRGEPRSQLRMQEVSDRAIYTSADTNQVYFNGRRVVQERYGNVNKGAAARCREEGVHRVPPLQLKMPGIPDRPIVTSANNDQAYPGGRSVQKHYGSFIAGQQPSEYGFFRGTASNGREQGTIAQGYVQQLRGHGVYVPERGPDLAFSHCDSLLSGQRYSYGRYAEQESFHIRSPEPRGQGCIRKALVATPYSLESMVTGKTMDEWMSSLRDIVGTNLSKLHWDIVNFCKTLELTQEQHEIRRDGLKYVEKTIHKLWPSAQVHLFGSTATGLALPCSDIDVAVMSSPQESSGHKSARISWLAELGRELRLHGQCQSLKQIPNAKVPLLKVVFKSGLACDISFNSHNGPRGVPVIRQFMEQYEALHPLCIVLKFFLRQQKLNELYTGGLGSFCLITMVVSHLQKLGVTGSGHDLGVLLLSFFTRYSIMHNYMVDVVSTRGAVCASKQAKGWVSWINPELLSVEDPLDPTSDIAKGSHKIKDIRSKFWNAKTLLLTDWNHDNVLAKLLDTKVTPNHTSKFQSGKRQGIKKRNQKKRKKSDTAGSEMEKCQGIKMRNQKKKKKKKKKSDTAGSEMEKRQGMNKRNQKRKKSDTAGSEMENRPGIKKRNQKKRKKSDTAGSEMEKPPGMEKRNQKKRKKSDTAGSEMEKPPGMEKRNQKKRKKRDTAGSKM